MKISFAFLFASLFFYSQTSYAVLATHSSRTSWEAALTGGSDYTVNFNSVAADSSYDGASVFDAGPFTLATVGDDVPSPFPFNLIDVTPFYTPGVLNGTPAARNRIGAGASAVTIGFDEPVHAFGGDFKSISGVTLTLSLLGGGTESLSIPAIGTTPSFFGFVSDPTSQYTSLSFTNDGMDEFWVMDDLSAAQAVPEPSAFLFGSLVCTFLGLRSARRGRDRR